MKKVILMSILGTLSTLSSGEILVNSSSDTQNILTNMQTTEDLSITSEGPGTSAPSSGGNPNPAQYLNGYEINNGSHLENIHNINLNNKYNNGVLLNNDSHFTNSGIMNLNTANSIGVISVDGKGNIINDTNGLINVSGGIGIATRGFSSAIFTGDIENRGIINVTNGGSAIFAYGNKNLVAGSITNSGTIKVDGGTGSLGSAVAISGYGAMKIVNAGAISGAANSTMPGNALIKGEDGANIENTISGTVIGEKNVSGIYAAYNGGSNITSVMNDGFIQVVNGTGIYSLGASITNNGTVISDKAGIMLTKYSGTAYGSSLMNNGDIILKKNGTAVTASQAVVENHGTILLEGNNGIGVDVYGGSSYEGKLINYGNITAAPGVTGVTLIKLKGSGVVGEKTATAYNYADLEALGDNSIVFYLTNLGKLNNSGRITVNNGIGIKLEYASLLEGENLGDIVVKGSGIGILAGATNYSGSVLVNDGNIFLESNGTGIYVTSNTTYNAGTTGENKGLITFQGEGATGIYVTGVKTSFKNGAELTSDQRNTTGIYLTEGATFENFGEIKLSGKDSVGISLNENAVLNNSGQITVDDGIGISVNHGLLGKDQNYGTISVFGDNGIGISGLSSTVINDGIIYVNGLGLGIYGNDSHIENYAFIEVSEGTGILAEMGSEVKNMGNIKGIGKSTGIEIVDSGHLNENDGEIDLPEGTNIKTINSTIINRGVLRNGNGTGIDASTFSRVFNENMIEVAEGIGISAKDNSEIENNGQITINNGTGILISDNSRLTNNASINVLSEGIGIDISDSISVSDNWQYIQVNKGTNIRLSNTSFNNNGELTNYEGTGIEATNSSITNSARVNIYGDGKGFAMKDTQLYNLGDIDVYGLGTGIKSENGYVYNTGNINIVDGVGISTDNSIINNSGDIRATIGISSTKNITDQYLDIFNYGHIYANDIGISDIGSSQLVNDGIIEASEIGLKLVNGERAQNYGEITSKIGVEIISGINEYSSHFYNNGKITGTEYAIKFDDQDSVLMLSYGSQISGKIDGMLGENTLILEGNVNLDTVDNFSKLVVANDSTLEGTINLKPITNSTYYSMIFDNSKDIADISNETLGELTLNGTINVGVDYDGIIDGTDKTGKILASSLNVQNGSIILTNMGTTTNDLITESGASSFGDQISIKSIVISDKQQAVDPNFSFQVSDGMVEQSGWVRETVSRIENGVTVLDEVYTNTNPDPIIIPPVDPIDPTDPENPTNPEGPNTGEESNGGDEGGIIVTPKPKPGITASNKKNSVPRSRVDLDNLRRITNNSNRFLEMEARNMEVGDRRQSLEYIGTAGSSFKTSNQLNYDYDVDSNGVSGTTLHKHTDTLYSGFTLGYTNNDVDYSNNDNEKIDSFNINIFGRYEKNNWNLDAYAAYGFNRHELSLDWLGAGRKDSDYNSHILQSGLSLGYNYQLGSSGLNLHPSIGVDYVKVQESTMKTQGLSRIESTSGDGVIGKMGVNLGSNNGKLVWNTGITYEQNFTGSFHNERKMVNNYVMEKLHYAKETLLVNVDADFKVTDNFTLKAGYEYEYNKDYQNHKFKTGISYILDEK